MGGYGSGRHPRKPPIGESLCLRLSELKAAGFLKTHTSVTGRWRWSRGGTKLSSVGLTVTTGCNAGQIAFDYAQSGKTHHEVISLEPVPMRFGGVRWWAICPISGRRCSVLVLGPNHGRFVSVSVSGLAYVTQNEAPYDRLIRKRYKAEERYASLSKYARRPTKERVLAALIYADCEMERAIEKFSKRLVANS